MNRGPCTRCGHIDRAHVGGGCMATVRSENGKGWERCRCTEFVEVQIDGSFPGMAREELKPSRGRSLSWGRTS